MRSGIRQKIYLGGWTISKAPSAFQPATEDAKDTARLADGSLDTSYAAPYVGCPDRVTKHDWVLTFANVRTSADLTALRQITSTAESMDFCPWLSQAEKWQLPDTSAVAQRRNAADVLDAGDIPTGTWTATCIGDSEATYSVTWGSPDTAAPWRHPWGPDSMAPEEPAWLVYYPVYRVEVVSFSVKFDTPHRETWTLNLKEV